MKISSCAVRHPVPPVALFLILMIMVWVSFNRLPVTELPNMDLPNMDLPVISVTVTLPNAAPDEIVARVIQPIEIEASDSAGLHPIDAIASDGTASLAPLPDLRVVMMTENGTRDISINVQGDTDATAIAAATALVAGMKTLPEVINVTGAANLARPEVMIRMKPDLAARYGITASTAAAALAMATTGPSYAESPKFRLGEDRLTVPLRLDQATRTDLTRFATIEVPAKDGTLVPLGLVAEAAIFTGTATVKRHDRAYVVTVEADLAPGVALGPATEAVFALPAATTDLPKGAAIQAGGDAETMNEIFGAFGLAMGTGLPRVDVVRVLLFNSFATPFTTMLSSPLAIGRAILALYIYWAGIGLSVVIGLLMLMGMVTKNAIMLDDSALEDMRQGRGRAKAILDAAQKRAPPIVITPLAVTAGMVPSTLAHATGGEFRAPMAAAATGGLILSTALSLIFVPALFSAIDGAKDHLGQVLFFGRRFAAFRFGRLRVWRKTA